MKNIFITGALGQDGKILTKILLTKKKYRVFLLGKKNDTSVKKKNKIYKSKFIKYKKSKKYF